MIAKMKKSLKLLKYGYHFGYNMGGMVLVLAIVALLYAVAFWLSADLFIFILIMLYVAIAMPSQIREDLLHSQMVSASPFRRFFEISFGDAYGFFNGIVAYVIHGVLLLLFYDKAAFGGDSVTVLLVSAGFCMGFMTASYAVINKTFWAGVLVYFVIGFVSALCSSVLSDLENSKALVLNGGGAFVLGLCLVLIGSLLAIWLRRLVYKKPYSRMSTNEELRRAMQQ